MKNAELMKFKLESRLANINQRLERIERLNPLVQFELRVETLKLLKERISIRRQLVDLTKAG